MDALSELTDRYGSAAIPGQASSFGGDNYPGLRSPALDRILADGSATLERARRDDAARQAEERLLAELPRLPLFARRRVVAASVELQGLRPAAPPVGETWNAFEWALAR